MFHLALIRFLVCYVFLDINLYYYFYNIYRYFIGIVEYNMELLYHLLLFYLLLCPHFLLFLLLNVLICMEIHPRDHSHLIYIHLYDREHLRLLLFLFNLILEVLPIFVRFSLAILLRRLLRLCRGLAVVRYEFIVGYPLDFLIKDILLF